MHLLSLSLTALLATRVSASPAVDKRTISCLTVGATATASWTNAAGQSCRWSGVVGSNFGANSANGGEYVVFPPIYPSIQYLTYLVGTAVTAAAEQVAQAPQSATYIHRIASRMMCAHGSTTLVVVRGKLSREKKYRRGCLADTVSSDPNCGAAYNAAVDDTIGGAAAGCSQTNPSNAVVRPSTTPTCS
jgi:hypothetical protein